MPPGRHHRGWKCEPRRVQPGKRGFHGFRGLFQVIFTPGPINPWWNSYAKPGGPGLKALVGGLFGLDGGLVGAEEALSGLVREKIPHPLPKGMVEKLPQHLRSGSDRACGEEMERVLRLTAGKKPVVPLTREKPPARFRPAEVASALGRPGRGDGPHPRCTADLEDREEAVALLVRRERRELGSRAMTLPPSVADFWSMVFWGRPLPPRRPADRWRPTRLIKP